MIKFKEGKRYMFKTSDLTGMFKDTDLSGMFGECIERNICDMEEAVVFRFSEKGLFCRCLIDYPLNNIEESEVVYCHLGDKLYMSDSRWVAE